MKSNYTITVMEFCDKHSIGYAFVISLYQSGLIELEIENETSFIRIDQLPLIEKYMRFYYEMDINLEGIETAAHLLQQIIALKKENIQLRNRLQIFELNEDAEIN